MTIEDRNAISDPAPATHNIESVEVVEKVETGQKAVKKPSSKGPSSVVAAAHAKQFAMSKRSILRNSSSLSYPGIQRANTLLDQPVSGELILKPWKETRDEFIKLAAASVPLYWMAKRRGWELKNFTLILNEKLSRRLDERDASASEYLRDEMTRRVRAALGDGTEFLYGIEKAPVALSDESSRRRWHLHGLIIGPVGFSARGKDMPLRRALQALKGEADADLAFQTPGEKLDLELRSSAIRWSFYAVKNGLTLALNPALAEVYDTPPGKQTHISAQLRREAQRWHDGALAGLTARELIGSRNSGLYGPQPDEGNL
ncbi:hypothetical protein [Pseudomonas sp. Q1-7]|uniref:hypothetical protein n=1 Tax=Pseudomonas sp. Q1-7 TaxID=3020843 RepID=UPI00230179DA|nr:hypothetical protein [Pseudomonas sp. Q1-7]